MDFKNTVTKGVKQIIKSKPTVEITVVSSTGTEITDDCSIQVSPSSAEQITPSTYRVEQGTQVSVTISATDYETYTDEFVVEDDVTVRATLTEVSKEVDPEPVSYPIIDPTKEQLQTHVDDQNLVRAVEQLLHDDLSQIHESKIVAVTDNAEYLALEYETKNIDGYGETTVYRYIVYGEASQSLLMSSDEDQDDVLFCSEEFISPKQAIKRMMKKPFNL